MCARSLKTEGSGDLTDLVRSQLAEPSLSSTHVDEARHTSIVASSIGSFATWFTE